jgi:hypothetical protein
VRGILQGPSLCTNSFGENLRCDRNRVYSPIGWLEEQAADVEARFLAVMEIPAVVGSIDFKLADEAFDELEGIIAADPKAIEYVRVIDSGVINAQ